MKIGLARSITGALLAGLLLSTSVSAQIIGEGGLVDVDSGEAQDDAAVNVGIGGDDGNIVDADIGGAADAQVDTDNNGMDADVNIGSGIDADADIGSDGVDADVDIGSGVDADANIGSGGADAEVNIGSGVDADVNLGPDDVNADVNIGGANGNGGNGGNGTVTPGTPGAPGTPGNPGTPGAPGTPGVVRGGNGGGGGGFTGNGVQASYLDRVLGDRGWNMMVVGGALCVPDAKIMQMTATPDLDRILRKHAESIVALRTVLANCDIPQPIDDMIEKVVAIEFNSDGAVILVN